MTFTLKIANLRLCCHQGAFVFHKHTHFILFTVTILDDTQSFDPAEITDFTTVVKLFLYLTSESPSVTVKYIFKTSESTQCILL